LLAAYIIYLLNPFIGSIGCLPNPSIHLLIDPISVTLDLINRILICHVRSSFRYLLRHAKVDLASAYTRSSDTDGCLSVNTCCTLLTLTLTHSALTVLAHIISRYTPI
jgi:hypothetical protein